MWLRMQLRMQLICRCDTHVARRFYKAVGHDDDRLAP